MQQEERERELARPRFISKEERERLALERLEKRRQEANKDTVMTSAASSLTPFEERLIIEKHLKTADNSDTRTKNRASEKRIKFDWSREDDTFVDDDPLYRLQSKVSNRSTMSDTSTLDKPWSRKSIEEMTDRDWRIVREDYSIIIQGAGHNIHPLRSWQEGRFNPEIERHLVQRFEEPTPIQRQVIPLALHSIDTIGLAETGSGKTMAYMIPILQKIINLRHSGAASVALHGPYAMVIVPTRELAQQIELAVKPIIRDLMMSVLVGGHRVEEQGWQMRNGAELVIGTPGRIRDFLERHLLVFSQCHHLVLDEADRMIDMNFEEDLCFILEQFPPCVYNSNFPKHTMMFSATMPAGCEKIAKGYMRKPISTVIVGSALGSGSAAVVDSIEQRVIMLKSESEKGGELLRVLQQNRNILPVIIFVNQKKTVDFVYDKLHKMGMSVGSLHGGKMQEQREAVIKQLRDGRIDILIATDIAGRGIDIPNVGMVLNYDMPARIEDYVHRVGRTGRAGKSGLAVTFITNDDSPVFYDLRQCLQRSTKSQVPTELALHEASMVKPGTVQQRKRKDEVITAFGL